MYLIAIWRKTDFTLLLACLLNVCGVGRLQAVCWEILGCPPVTVGNRRRHHNQSVHYSVTPQWAEILTRVQNNNLQPQFRGEVCGFTVRVASYANDLTWTIFVWVCTRVSVWWEKVDGWKCLFQGHLRGTGKPLWGVMSECLLNNAEPRSSWAF